MRTHLGLIAYLVAVSLAAPLAAGHMVPMETPCSQIPDESDAAIGDLYVLRSDPRHRGIWQEGNGLEGLQTHYHTCRLSSGNIMTVYEDQILLPL